MYTTRKTLIQQIKNSDELSWDEFYGIYRPLVFAIGKKLLLSPSDCEDLMQKVMLVLFDGGALLRYDAGKGKFRTWFGSIVRNKAMEMVRESARNSTSASAFPFPLESPARTDAHDPFQELFDDEYCKYLFSLALDELRSRVEPETYDIFEMVVLQERSPKDVALYLGMNRATIDVYCSRCRKKLREIVSEIRIDNPEFNPSFPI